MRLLQSSAITALVLLLGACSRGASSPDALPDDLKRDLASASTSSDFAPAGASGSRMQFVSSIERTESSAPAASPKVAKQPAPPMHRRPTTHAPAKAKTPMTVASASESVAEPAPVPAPTTESAPISEPAPEPASAPVPSSIPTSGSGRGTHPGRGQGSGGAVGGILGGILGSVIGGGGGGYGHHGHGHHGDGDGDRDRDRRGGGMGYPLAN